MFIKHIKMLFLIAVILSCQCTAFAAFGDESKFIKKIEKIKQIAEATGIIRYMGQDSVVIDGSQENGIVITHFLGGASHDKYEIITPIVDVKQDTIYIDCSYARNYNSSTEIISFEGICRGKIAATPDIFENGVENGFGITYSPSASWLRNIEKMPECKSLSGLIYAGIYFVRCQKEKYNGLTENTMIIALSPEFNKLFTIHGYEFIPIKPSENVTVLRFVGLKRESHYEIMEMNISKTASVTTYKPEKVFYPFSIDEAKRAVVRQKSHLYGSPSVSDKTQKYLIAGDKVTVNEHTAGFCRITYTGGKAPLQMWMMCDALEPAK